MRLTCSNFLSIVICVFLICVQYFYSFPGVHESFPADPVVSIKVNLPPFSEEIAITKTGETIEIFCTGRKSNELVALSMDNNGVRDFGETKEIVNDTTMRVMINIKEPVKMNVACVLNYFKVPGDQQITLIVNGPPNVENFRCKSDNFVSLHCAWTTTTLFASFKLYVINDNDRPAIICDIPYHEVNGSSSHDLSCTWHKKKNPRYTPEAATLNFLMEYCNYTHCLNKTYKFNHLSIVKLDPPIRLIVNDGFTLSGNKGVSFQWTIPQKTLNLLKNGVEERVRYLTLGTRPREVNTTDNLILGRKGIVPFYLTSFFLPCSGRMYEIKVSVKTKEAIREEYWSDYASILYKTGANRDHSEYNDDPPDDASCEDPDILETGETMLRDLRMFQVKFKKEQLELKNKIKKLQEKVAQRVGK